MAGFGTATAFFRDVRHFFPIAFFALLVWGGAGIWNSRPIHHAPGVLVPMEPVQQDELPRSLPEVAGFKLTGVARYALRARVLGTKRYWSGRGTQLVPVDVALGWGPMSDEAVLGAMRLSQSNRFFFYEWDNTPPIPANEIMTHASNNHVIAANAEVARAVKALRPGQITQMQGWLVEAAGPNGFRWGTSRRRDDTGDGACELFYVESIAAVDKIEPMSPATTVAAHNGATF
jgi:hypothetical protein